MGSGPDDPLIRALIRERFFAPPRLPPPEPVGRAAAPDVDWVAPREVRARRRRHLTLVPDPRPREVTDERRPPAVGA